MTMAPLSAVAIACVFAVTHSFCFCLRAETNVGIKKTNLKNTAQAPSADDSRKRQYRIRWLQACNWWRVAAMVRLFRPPFEI